MMPKSLLTIAMPVYNEEAYLGKAISSILAQSLDDLTLLISDNASSDRSWDIIQSFAKSDKRVVCYRHATNVGAFRNFVSLLEKSNSEFFAWSGSHDFTDVNCYQELVQTLQRCKTAILAYGTTHVIDGDENRLEINDQAPMDFAEANPLERALKIVVSLTWCHLFYGVYRSSELKRCRIFVPSIGPDHVVLMEAAFRGKILFCSDAIYFRREYRTEGYEGSQFLRGQLSRALGRLPEDDEINDAYLEWWFQHLWSAWRVEGSLFERIARAKAISGSFTARWHPNVGTRYDRLRYLLKKIYKRTARKSLV
jgi:glycosyltransferase involved in cell wall biosynthesis